MLIQTFANSEKFHGAASDIPSLRFRPARDDALPMHRTSLHLPDALWAEVKKRAALHGVTASQYVREAVIARIYDERAREGDRSLARALGLARRKR